MERRDVYACKCAGCAHLLYSAFLGEGGVPTGDERGEPWF